MNKILIILFVVTGNVLYSLSQFDNFTWVKETKGTTVVPFSMAIQSNGNIINVGVFSDSVDLDPGSGTDIHTTNSFFEGYFQIFDSSGTLLSARSFSGNSNTDFLRPFKCAIDSNDNIILYGSFLGTYDLDASQNQAIISSNGSSEQGFALKLDPNGNYLWHKQFNANLGFSAGLDICIDFNNNIYLAGSFEDSISFDQNNSLSTLYSQQGHDGFIVKLDENGQFLNLLHQKSSTDAHMFGIGIGTDSSIYIRGDFKDSCTFELSNGQHVLSATNNNSSQIIFKADTQFNPIWDFNFTGKCDNFSFKDQTLITDSNTLFLTFEYLDTAKLHINGTLTEFISNGEEDILLLCLNNQGHAEWAKSFGGLGKDLSGIQSITPNEIIVFGDFHGTVEFNFDSGGSAITANGNPPNDLGCFFSKIDANGNFIEVRTMNRNFSVIRGLKRFGTDIFLSGHFRGEFDADLSANSTILHSQGNFHMFLIKMSICSPNVTIDSIKTCEDSYVWIDGITYTSNNNTASVTFENSQGCDSVITLNLTLNAVPTGTDKIEACQPYTWIDGNTYTSNNNTATHTLTTSEGCDSIVTLDLTFVPGPTGTDEVQACQSYTWIDGFTYTSNNYTATHTLTSSEGCDSIVTLNLTIGYPETSTDVINACNSYTWIDGNTYISDNNTATYTLQTQYGCDSVVTLDLTIDTVNTGLFRANQTLTAKQNNGTYQWLNCNTGQIILEATQQYYNVSDSGSYACIVTYDGCTDTTDCFDFASLGLDAIAGSDFKIYPNPNAGKFTVDFGQQVESASLKIWSMDGKLVKTIEVTNQSKTVVEYQAAPGVYWLEIDSEMGSRQLRLNRY